MKTKRDKIIEQITLQEEIQNIANINIVECGNCGSPFLHRRSEEEIECPYCERIMEPCDCPDFLYRGMENNSEFN